MIFYAICKECDVQSENFPDAEMRETWLEYHWVDTDHWAPTRVDNREHEHVHVPGLRRARFKGQCRTCRDWFGAASLIAPLGLGWECKPCAVSRHSTKQREEQGK